MSEINKRVWIHSLFTGGGRINTSQTVPSREDFPLSLVFVWQMGLRVCGFVFSAVSSVTASNVLSARFAATAQHFCGGHLRLCRILCAWGSSNCNWVIRLPR